MKKIITILLFGAMVLLLCACGSGKAAKSEITKVGIGQSIETDNFKMVVETMEIMDEYSIRVSEISSRDLYVEEGYKLLVVQGTMENTGSTVIYDRSFVKSAIVNGDYKVENDKVTLTFERDRYNELDPYTERRYDLYINIPEKLAEQFETATFTLGFKDDMSIIATVINLDSVTTDATNWFEITK